MPIKIDLQSEKDGLPDWIFDDEIKHGEVDDMPEFVEEFKTLVQDIYAKAYDKGAASGAEVALSEIEKDFCLRLQPWDMHIDVQVVGEAFVTVSLRDLALEAAKGFEPANFDGSEESSNPYKTIAHRLRLIADEIDRDS